MKHRFALQKLYRQMQKSRGEQQSRLKARYEKWLAESISLRQQRLDLPLTIEFPEQLPVSRQRDHIADLLEKHQVVIVAGETGSGKTTQLGKLCLSLGRGREGMIGHTQPRRIAAHSVADRIAEELQVLPGQEVGCKVRFFDNSSELTLLKVMTDGVLLAEIAHDPFLEQYDTLIIDEAHERSLNIDFLLGYIKRILPRRPDLKLVITSATIDVERFANYFNGAPVVTVTGRSYPVDIVYRPLPDEPDMSLPDAVARVLEEIDQHERNSPGAKQLGDVLVFLPGEYEIRECSRVLRKSQQVDCEVLPLYARLPRKEQQKIFTVTEKKARRRVVLSTNVAETSLTVPGIHYVIDSGLARMSRYSYRSKVQRLPVEKISCASANQRAGRCGRISHGVCFRLYDEQDFDARDAFTEPEIVRSNLASVILQMASLNLGDIQSFDFIEPPDKRLINDGLRQLQEQGALTEKRKLTAVGRKMAALPLEPALARIVLAADKARCLKEILVIASALSIPDPRSIPADRREAAREKLARFNHPQSDFLTFYQLFAYCEEQRQALSQNRFRKLCQTSFLSWQRMYEWRNIHRQLKQACEQLGLRENADNADYACIHQALLTGFVTQIGQLDEKRQYLGPRNRRFRLFPGSVLAGKPPKWVMAAQLIETSQLYAHCAARIEPEWVYPVAEHLLKFQYHEPHWSTRQGQVRAWRQASLYGLVVEEKRPVSFSAIDPALAHRIFIQSALVEERLKTAGTFFRHNRDLKQQVHKLEEKSRRRDLAASDEAVYAFYEQRIPGDICTAAGFEKWRKKTEAEQPNLLFADKSVFMAGALSSSEQARFPDYMEWLGVKYRLQYRFSPGKADDGVSVQLPLAALNRVPRFLFDWLVPGMLAEKVEALIKTLPKQYRKQLVPVPDTVAGVAGHLQADDKPLHTVLSDLIRQRRGIAIPYDAWQADKLDDYYRANFRLLDDNGQLLAQSRDLAVLIERFGEKARQTLTQETGDDKKAPEYYTRWTFPDLQQQRRFRHSGTQVTVYPAICDKGDKVSLVQLDYPHVQAEVHRRGLIRLAMLELAKDSRYLRKELLKGNALQLKMSTEFRQKDLLEDLLFATFGQTFFADSLVFDKAAFDKSLKEKRSGLVNCAQMLEKLLRAIIEEDYEVRQWLDKLADKKPLEFALADVRAQRQALLVAHFPDRVDYQHLQHFPRYLKAMAQRLSRLGGQLDKNRQVMAELETLTERWQQMQKRYPDSGSLPLMQEYRWMLEEYRVSQFAQQLKTPKPVSIKRLDTLWQTIEKAVQQNFL